MCSVSGALFSRDLAWCSVKAPPISCSEPFVNLVQSLGHVLAHPAPDGGAGVLLLGLWVLVPPFLLPGGAGCCWLPLGWAQSRPGVPGLPEGAARTHGFRPRPGPQKALPSPVRSLLFDAPNLVSCPMRKPGGPWAKGSGWFWSN